MVAIRAMQKFLLQNRPIGLTIIAAAPMLQGLEALMGMVGALSQGKLNINLTVLALFAGIGLLKLSEGWRKFTLVCLGLLAIGLVGVVVYETVRPGQMQVTWYAAVVTGGARYPLFAAIWLFCAGIVWWAYRTLTHPEIVALFKRPPGAPPRPWPEGDPTAPVVTLPDLPIGLPDSAAPDARADN